MFKPIVFKVPDPYRHKLPIQWSAKLAEGENGVGAVWIRIALELNGELVVLGRYVPASLLSEMGDSAMWWEIFEATRRIVDLVHLAHGGGHGWPVETLQ